MTFQPANGRVLVLPDTPKTETDFGLFLPEIAQQMPFTGTVLAVGPGELAENGTRIPVGVEVGDRVLWMQYAGTDLKTKEGQVVTLIANRDLVAKVES